MKRPLEVLVFGRSGFIGSFLFTAPRITIGRQAESMVVLDDPQVSLKHAELFLEGGLFRIRDLGSRTGTRVNGAPLLPRQPIEPTDDITIGPFRLRATICDAASADAPSSRESQRPAADTLPTVPPPPAPETELGAATVETPALAEPPRARRAVDPAAPLPPPVPWEEAVSVDEERTREWQRNELASGAKGASRPVPPLPSASKRPAPPPPPMTAAATPPPPKVKPVPVVPSAVPAVTLSAAAPVVTEDEERRIADDDDEDDEQLFVPSFDLVAELSTEGLRQTSSAPGATVALELVYCRGERIVAIRHPSVAGAVVLPGAKAAVGALEGAQNFSLYLDACRLAAVKDGGRTLTSEEVKSASAGSRFRVNTGMQVSAEFGEDERVLVHWVPRASALPPPKLSFRPSAGNLGTAVLSVAVHIAALAVIGLLVLGGRQPSNADVNAGRFVTINPKELELEPPPPPEPPPVAETATAEPMPQTAATPASKHDTTRGASPKLAGRSDAQATPSNAAAQRILSALGGAPTATSTISITNLDALPVGAGEFKVSGTVGKAPGDTLRIGAVGGGGSAAETKSANELGGNDLGRVHGRTGNGNVRARVTAAPEAIRGEGHLDRGEIQKVVNAHLYQVQGCYERQLAKDPSLSGKISFDWVVGPTGSVSNVRVGRSTVQSVETTTCIQSAIQGWKFPAPQGGSVTVTYPFAFSALGG